MKKTLLITALLATASVQATDRPTPPEVVLPEFQDCVEYRLEKSTSTYDRHTKTWSEFTDWPNSGPLDWGIYPGELSGPHNNSGTRWFVYVIVDERPIESEECQPPLPPPQPVPTMGVIASVAFIIAILSIGWMRRHDR